MSERIRQWLLALPQPWRGAAFVVLVPATGAAFLAICFTLGLLFPVIGLCYLGWSLLDEFMKTGKSGPDHIDD